MAAAPLLDARCVTACVAAFPASNYAVECAMRHRTADMEFCWPSVLQCACIAVRASKFAVRRAVLC
jgi:hypothetical protein